jgi:hypothetical protein
VYYTSWSCLIVSWQRIIVWLCVLCNTNLKLTNNFGELYSGCTTSAKGSLCHSQCLMIHYLKSYLWQTLSCLSLPFNKLTYMDHCSVEVKHWILFLLALTWGTLYKLNRVCQVLYSTVACPWIGVFVLSGYSNRQWLITGYTGLVCNTV